MSKNLNTYKSEIIELCNQKGWLGPSIEQVYMYFIEEVGELASAIRRQKNQFRDKKKVKIESELGDVFSYLFQIAYMLNIDLEIMWEKQKDKILKKKYYTIHENNKGNRYNKTSKDLFCNDKAQLPLQERWKMGK